MPRAVLFGAAALAVALALIGWRMAEGSRTETIVESPVKPPSAAPLCPWREPDADMKRFFPQATRYEVETVVLSGLRMELAQRLGRPVTGDENALHIYRIWQDAKPLGSVLTRRVKGAYGGIEVVLAADVGGSVRGVRLQRLREPEPVARALENPDWLRSFEGKRADSPWQIGMAIPEVPAEAQASAQAIVDGARSLLILLEAAEHAGLQDPDATIHHH